MTASLQKAAVGVLKNDPFIQAIVNDPHGFGPKVFDSGRIPGKVEPPYIIIHRISGGFPEGDYGDNESIRFPSIQVSVWGRDAEEAEQLFAQVSPALKGGDWIDLEPQSVGSITSLGDELEVVDLETNLIHIPGTFRFLVTS